MELKKNHFLGALVFGHSCCSSSNSTENSTEHEGICPFPCQRDSSIPAFRDMHLHVIEQKKYSITFCIKLTIYMYIKYI